MQARRPRERDRLSPWRGSKPHGLLRNTFLPLNGHPPEHPWNQLET